ncbi:hypothetical protein BD408DRAFT_173782 [Parasitella parasitica]|nr:hypothetical protein BD408DRAFT_173782 [Parasitella parasitica]
MCSRSSAKRRFFLLLPAQSPSNALQHFQIVVASYEIRVPNSSLPRVSSNCLFTFSQFYSLCIYSGSNTLFHSINYNTAISKLYSSPAAAGFFALALVLQPCNTESLNREVEASCMSIAFLFAILFNLRTFQ